MEIVEIIRNRMVVLKQNNRMDTETGYRDLPEAKPDISRFLLEYYSYRRPHNLSGGLPPVIAEQPKLVSGNT